MRRHKMFESVQRELSWLKNLSWALSERANKPVTESLTFLYFFLIFVSSCVLRRAVE